MSWLKLVLRNYHGSQIHYTKLELESMKNKLKKLEEKSGFLLTSS